MARKDYIALLVLYASVAVVGLVVGIHGVAAGVLLAPLAFFVPGYGICLAVDPYRPLDAERVLLAVAISLATTVVSGVALNGIRLDRTVWAVFLLVLTYGCAAIGWLRIGVESDAGGRPPGARGQFRQAGRWAVLVMFVVGCLAAAVVVTLRAARHTYNTPLTVLSSIPVGSYSHQITVVNLTPSSHQYYVQVRASRAVTRFLVRLAPAQTWRHQVINQAGGQTATLFNSTGQPISRVDWTP